MFEKTNPKGGHAVVTGAASGIGRATAIALARRGLEVTLVDVAAEKLAAVAAEIGAVRAVEVVDLADEAAVDALGARLVAGGPIDVLVSNAGVAVVKPFVQTTADDWRWVLGVNALAPLRLARAVVPAMLARRSGHLVFVASLAGLVAPPGMVAYGTSKFALVGLAEGLRLELAGSGVEVSIVCPGYVRTNLSRATRYANEAFRRFVDDAPRFYGLSAEAVAGEITEAIARRRPLVVLGPEKVGWWLKRLSPEVAFRVARVASRLTRIGDAAEDPCTSR